jgi:hypothetical protein
MADLLLMGGGSDVYMPDALVDFSASAETGVIVKMRGKMFLPGSGEGERIFRRLYITVLHTSGVSFYVTPYVDGVLQTALRTFCSRPATSSGEEERVTFSIPLYRYNPDFPNHTFGLRGTAIEVEIEATAPTTEWHATTVGVAYQPINNARGNALGDAS